MRLTRLLAAGAIAASLAAGAVGGAVLFSPTVGVAQTATQSPSSSDGTTSTDHTTSTRVRGGPCGLGDQLGAAAEAIGIEESDLVAAIRDGQSIAEVAQDNGVAVSTVVEAMIAEAESAIDQAVEDGRLTQAQADEKKADLSDRLTAIVNGEPLSEGDGGTDGLPHQVETRLTRPRPDPHRSNQEGSRQSREPSSS